VVDAGEDVTLILPDDAVVLDGGNSRDEYGIKSYAWDRDSASPASGVSRSVIDVIMASPIRYIGAYVY